MKAKDVLTKARYILSDTSKDRWTDERLLSLLDDCLSDITKKTTIFVETIFYPVANLVVDIDLSDQAFKFLRAEYLDEPLPFYSFDEMDSKDKEWQLEEGDEVKALVYDKQKSGLLKQYPIIRNSFNPYVEYTSLYGVTTHFSYSDVLPEFSETFGDVSHFENKALIKLYYIRQHAKVTDINDDLLIDDFTEMPMAHYIAGMALRDNRDVQNRTMSVEELQLYNNMVNEHNLEKSELFVRADHTARYRPHD